MARHSLTHFEWSSTDLERTRRLLEGLFEWDIEPWGENYLVFRTPEGPSGGIMKVDEVSSGESPYIYIEVDEIEPYLNKAVELGAQVDVPETEIPKVGWYAHIKDDDGNIFGIFKNLES
jgi:predicted enzyme related to lactoylglutathione lyase